METLTCMHFSINAALMTWTVKLTDNKFISELMNVTGYGEN